MKHEPCEDCGKSSRGGTVRRRGVLQVHLCPSCSPKKKAEHELFLDHDEAAALLAAAREDGELAYRLIFVALHLGPRASELVELRGSDFDWPRSRVLVDTLKRKGRPRLPVWFGPELGEQLRTIVGTGDGFLFPRSRGARGRAAGGAISRRYAAEIFKRCAAKAGLSPATSIHACRHYFAIRTLEQSGDLYFTQRQCRHASIRTTERYLHLLPDRARATAARVTPISQETP